MVSTQEFECPVMNLLPMAEVKNAHQLLDQLRKHETLAPFDDRIIDFCSKVSRALSRAGRKSPDIQALSFWMRKAELIRLKESFESQDSHSARSFPRGTIFHIPPANVDTVFVYSWLLSLLVGNRNIVRVSERNLEEASVIIDVLREIGTEFPDIMDRSLFVSYPRESKATEVFSASCDTRVIWGGDISVNAIRRIPIPPLATELAFPDRYSVSAIHAQSFLQLEDGERTSLANKFVSDSYLFDQLGCSSPRGVFWVGSESDANESSEAFLNLLSQDLYERAITVDTATAIGKVAAAYGAAVDLDGVSIETKSNELTVIDVARFPNLAGDFCGGGFFAFSRGDSLLDLIPSLTRQAQTLSYFGFSRDELNELVGKLNGRAIDRLVPIGTALAFDRVWDGFDLLQAFTRKVTVT